MIIAILISLMIMPIYSADQLIENIKNHEKKREKYVGLAKLHYKKREKRFYSSMIANYTEKSYRAQESLRQMLIAKDRSYENIQNFEEYLKSNGLKYWPNPKNPYNPNAPIFIPSSAESKKS